MLLSNKCFAFSGKTAGEACHIIPLTALQTDVELLLDATQRLKDGFFTSLVTVPHLLKGACKYVMIWLPAAGVSKWSHPEIVLQSYARAADTWVLSSCITSPSLL